VLDADGGGFNRSVDCDDASAAIHPGAVDMHDNGIDEDCDGADASSPVVVATVVPTPAPTVAPPKPKPVITITVPYFMSAKKKATTFSTLSVKGVPAGATIKVSCKGTCPKKSLTITSAKGGTVALTAYRKKPLKVGTTLTVQVTKAGMTGMAKVIKIRAAKRPSVTTKVLP